MFLHGREKIFAEEAGQKLNEIANTVDAKIDVPLKNQGGMLFIQFSPKNK